MIYSAAIQLVGGKLYSPSAYFMKHPPKQFTDDAAYRMLEEFIAGQDIEGELIESGDESKLSQKVKQALAAH